MRQIVFVAAVLVALSCGGNNNQMMMDVPVKQQPLAGTINGKPFTGVSATASAQKAFWEDGGRWLDVYETQVDCAVFSPDPDREVIGTIPWTVHNYNFDGQHNMTIVYKDDAGTPQNLASLNGRVELVETGAPDGGLGTIRLRVDFDSNNTVEGEIKVQICD